MQNYILIGINLISIFGLVIIIFKPEWIDKFRLKFGIEEANQEQILPPSTPTSNELNQPDNNSFEDKKSKIVNKLALAKYSFLDTTTNGVNSLNSVIDNISDYLKSINSSEGFILDIIEKNLHRIDTSRPESEVENNQPSPEIIDKRNKIAAELTSISNLLFYYVNANSTYNGEIKNFYKSALAEISEELKKFRKLKDILANASTIDIYQIEKRQHVISYIIYLALFFLFIILGLAFAYFSIGLKSEIIGAHKENLIDYWVLKASGVFIFITLISFFLKQAIHHQKRKEQVEKTMLELKALPSYMAELSSEDAKKLRNDLASKYFGNSNDNSTINEISGLLTEQLKNSTEVAKASSEAIKALSK